MKTNDLIGKWISDPNDPETLENYGNVSLEFDDGGGLKYTIHLDDKDQKILLEYELQGDILITDQPSSPRKEKTKIHITGDKLILKSGKKRSQYLKFS